MPDVVPPPGRWRTYGPTVATYLLATAATTAYQWGDSIDYAIELQDRKLFWEFGHLFWRPLGALLTAIVPTSLLPGVPDDRAAIIVLLAAVCWLAGLGCVVWLRGLLRWAGLNGIPADLAVGAFIVSQAFLNNTQTASSYVPGLAMLLLGCYLLARASAQEKSSRWAGVGAGAALAAAVGFWFLYVWALPAAILLPLFLGGADRARFGLCVRAAAVCVLVVAACYAVPLVALEITSVAGLRAWIADASHGVANVRGVSRAAFGFSRSFIHMGNDGVLFKRYLLHDPLNPTSAADLARLSLWKLGLFYLFLLALAVGLLYTPRGRRLLGLLGVATLPTLGFAIAWQGGDLERYLPLYPYLFLGVGGLLALPRAPLVCKVVTVVFFGAALLANGLVMARPVRAQEHARLVARVEGFHDRLPPNSRIFYVRDEIEGLNRNFPIHAERDELPLEGVTAPGLADSANWRADLSQRIRAVWDKGGEVWFAKRLLAETPRPEWNWVEGDDPDLSWHDVSAYFRSLETDADLGGADGFVRIKPSPENHRLLK